MSQDYNNILVKWAQGKTCGSKTCAFDGGRKDLGSRGM
jgi:hypothetical protein